MLTSETAPHIMSAWLVPPIDGSRLQTAVYAHAGHLEEAKQAATKFLEAFLGMTILEAIAVVLPKASLIERIAEGLRRVGLAD
jgi:hypothetical protein